MYTSNMEYNSAGNIQEYVVRSLLRAKTVSEKGIVSTVYCLHRTKWRKMLPFRVLSVMMITEPTGHHSSPPKKWFYSLRINRFPGHCLSSFLFNPIKCLMWMYECINNCLSTNWVQISNQKSLIETMVSGERNFDSFSIQSWKKNLNNKLELLAFFSWKYNCFVSHRDDEIREIRFLKWKYTRKRSQNHLKINFDLTPNVSLKIPIFVCWADVSNAQKWPLEKVMH